MFRRVGLCAVILTILFLTSGGPALAARPGAGSARSSLALVVIDTTDGVARYGGTVTFAIVTTATDYPYVQMKCWQDGVFLGEAWRGFFPTSLSGQIFTLSGSSSWRSDRSADCTAYLTYQTKKGWATLASTSFTVQP